MTETRKGKKGNIGEFYDNYDDEYTQESYKELQRLAFWASRTGPTFYVIGGWAAWYYHHGLGSRDIDIVFPDKGILELFLQRYYRQNGYEQVRGLLAKRFRKRVMVRKAPVYVEIDAASIKEGPPLKEDPTRNLPFSTMLKNNLAWDIGPASVRIPAPELLLLMKIKAHRDRNWTLDYEAISPLEVAYLRGKIWKDEFDIRNVASIINDWPKVKRIAKQHHIAELVEDTLSNLRIERGR